jgi:hypothetical protein
MDVSRGEVERIWFRLSFGCHRGLDLERERKSEMS